MATHVFLTIATYCSYCSIGTTIGSTSNLGIDIIIQNMKDKIERLDTFSHNINSSY